MKTPSSLGWYRRTFGAAGRLTRLPDVVGCPHWIMAEVSSSRGKTVLLVSVDNAHKVPKGLKYNVQFMMPGWEPAVNKSVLLGSNGQVKWSRPND